ncbi:MAG: flagellar basal body-associated FliL family protein [Alphaproteobacteria bacterium]|jgi:flagellar FliL protein|nr:flagellar basal body protein FliL [Magnetovibrio sp.]UTW50721.1 flagellar basal body-associated FliL family protein [bacterium SCSIO 12827]HBT43934.1 flagellar basal body protein FliL [Rhodospirillaceae bacterium]HCS70787.1 flagellar basal body protein FliL [Rhodospirillaceae bacterium]|tara:strand:- start:1421 stop:1978 length:558 start_codon:yes stop_codon:yes gene_type:complete
MADDDDLENEEVGGADEDADGEEGGSSEGASKSKKKLIIIVAVLLLVVGGAAAAFFTGLLEPLISMITGKDSSSAVASGEAPEGIGLFHDLPEVLVNLNTAGRKSQFLKMKVSLEVASEQDKLIIDAVKDRVMDNFQVYLRELRIEDLQGSAGMYRLREELLRRVRAATAPAQVKDVLFKEMLVQ